MFVYKYKVRVRVSKSKYEGKGSWVCRNRNYKVNKRKVRRLVTRFSTWIRLRSGGVKSVIYLFTYVTNFFTVCLPKKEVASKVLVGTHSDITLVLGTWVNMGR